MTDLDSEIVRLRGDNERLSEELSQAKSDKEFVWSLWKRLQVASPDLTQAISLVVQREKEKAEVKDAKVLQILQMKDTKIEELQQIVTKQSKELTLTIQKKADLVDRVKKLEADVVTSSEQNKQLTCKIRGLDNNAEEERRQVEANYERQQRELSSKVSSLQVELTRVKAEAGDLQASNIALESRSSMAEKEITRLRFELTAARESAVRAAESSREEAARLRADLDRRTEDANNLLTKLNTAEALSAQQEAALMKLQAREQNNETILRSRQKAQTKNADVLARQVASLTAENRALRSRHPGANRRLTMTNLATADDSSVEDDEEDGIIARRKRHTSSDSEGPVVDLDYRMERLQRQVQLLEGNLRRRESVIRCLKEASEPSCGRRAPTGPYVRPNRAARLRSRSAPMRAPRRCLPVESLRRQLAIAERRGEELEQDVAARDEEMCGLKQELQQRSRKIQQLRSEVQRQRAAVQELAGRQRTEEARREHLELRAALREVSAAKEELEADLDHLQRQRAADENALRELHHRVKFDGDTAECDSREKERLSLELERVKSAMRVLEEDRQLSERQNNNSFAAWEAERRGYRAEMQAMAEELSSKRLELTRLERELQQLRAESERRGSGGMGIGGRGSGGGGGGMAGILEHFAAAEEARTEEGGQGEEEEESAATPPSSGRRQTANILRRRLVSLQQQLRSVRKSRSHLTSSLTAVQSRNRQLSQELDAANARCQRLKNAIDRGGSFTSSSNNNNCANIDSNKNNNNNSNNSAVSSARSVKEAETVAEVSATVAALKEEVAAKEGRLSEVRERLARSERELGQKRTLIEELRARAKSAQDAAKTDREGAEAATQRIRELAENSERLRVQLDSCKRRLAAVTSERKRLEAEAVPLRREAEQKTRAASEAVAKRSEAERKLSAASKAHEAKLNEVVRRNEAGVAAARGKVAELQGRLLRARRLLLRLSRGLGQRAAEVKAVAEAGAADRRKAESGDSLRAARERAADILDLSLEDVDDILHPSSSSAGRRSDEEWERRCERLLGDGEVLDDAAVEALWRCFDEKLAQMVASAQAAVTMAQA